MEIRDRHGDLFRVRLRDDEEKLLRYLNGRRFNSAFNKAKERGRHTASRMYGAVTIEITYIGNDAGSADA